MGQETQASRTSWIIPVGARSNGPWTPPVGGILIKEIKLFIASTLRVASLCWHQPSCPWHLFPFLENKAGTTVPFLRIPLPPSPFLPPGSLTRLIARGETRRKRIDRAILKSSTRRGEKQGCNSRKRRARRSIVRVFVQTLSYKCPALFSAFHAFERFVWWIVNGIAIFRLVKMVCLRFLSFLKFFWREKELNLKRSYKKF